MKIEVDLSEVFEDEEGGVFRPETKEAIMVAVVEKIYRAVEKNIGKSISDQIENIVCDRLAAAMETLIENLMDYEFTETGSYGQTKGTTTIRNRIFKEIESHMVWKEGRYSSDNNSFTKAALKVIEDKMKTFQDMFNKEVDAQFTKDCMAYATKKLQERLGIK